MQSRRLTIGWWRNEFLVCLRQYLLCGEHVPSSSSVLYLPMPVLLLSPLSLSLPSRGTVGGGAGVIEEAAPDNLAGETVGADLAPSLANAAAAIEEGETGAGGEDASQEVGLPEACWLSVGCGRLPTCYCCMDGGGGNGSTEWRWRRCLSDANRW